jgi:shikimate 5-dehydrogenase
MSVQINKDTKLYGSFSENPGNNGCIFFNNAFEKYNINAIYKSFYSNNIEETIQSVKHLRFSGFALSMPHKISVIKFLDKLDYASNKIGAINTVLIENGNLIGYNTDYLGIIDLFKIVNVGDNINIIGNGGFSRAIQYACDLLDINYKILERKDTKNMFNTYDEVFLNATPEEFTSAYNKIIDLRPTTHYGKIVAEYQAKHQFKLYTGIDYEES